MAICDTFPTPYHWKELKVKAQETVLWDLFYGSYFKEQAFNYPCAFISETDPLLAPRIVGPLHISKLSFSFVIFIQKHVMRILCINNM